MRCLFLFFLLSILTCGVTAQDKKEPFGKVMGQLYCRDTRQLVSDAVISIHQATDSSIVSVTFSDERGGFLIRRLPIGKYKLHITYIGYQPLWYEVLITEKDSLVSFGSIHMERTGVNLGIIEIINKKPLMVVKKDTLEFNAAALGTWESAMVEELLKRLPGVRIDRDGTIKVNGETIEGILIDGMPFGGKDGTMATRNLSAEMIDKIQIIDKRSDWSQFTGIDDGQRRKAINLTVREDSKGAYWGRINGALGTQNHFGVNGNVNRFNDESQISLGTSGTDINGYQVDGGNGKIGIGGNSSIRNWSVGGNYNRGFGKRLKVGVSYSLNDSQSHDRRSSQRLNMLPDTTWYYSQSTRLDNSNVNHALNSWMEFHPDTSVTLNVSTSLGYGMANSLQENLFISLNERRQLLNDGSTEIANSIKSPAIFVSGFLGKKFRKRGRTVGINVGVGQGINKQQTFNRYSSLFVEPDGDFLRDSIDQKGDVNSLNRSVTVSIIYTEPIMKNRYIEVTYGYSSSYNKSDKYTYDYDSVRKEYGRRNDSLTNAFASNFSIHQVGFRILTQKTKYSYNLVLNIQFNDLENTNITLANQIRQRSVNFFPSAILNYVPSSERRLQFSYSGSTQQPSTAQLQPIPDNSNPLYIQLGNSNLKPTFYNSFNVNYASLNPAKMRNLSAEVSVGFISNRIVNASWFDSLGRQVSQPQNINGSYNINSGLSISFPLRKQQTSIDAGILLGVNRDVSYINNAKGSTQTFNLTPNLNFSFNYKNVFDFTTSTSAGYNSVVYAVQKGNNTWFFSYKFSLEGNIRLPFNIVIGGNFDFMQNSGVGGYNQRAAMLNAFITKGLLKHRRALVRLQGFDLLNGNAGISRVVGSNYIEDIETAVAQRMYLMSFSYFLKRTDK